MTFQSLIPVAPDGAHAGDLVGYDKWGRPMHLPGGGARDGQVVTEPDDDDPATAGGDDDDDDDDSDDHAPAKSNKPTYKQLLEQVAALSAQVDPEQRRRLNTELRKNREVRQLLDKHKTSPVDLAKWLEERAAGSTAPPPAAVTPPEATGGQPEPEPVDEPVGPVFDQAEIDRLVEEKLEERLAEDGGRADLLLGILRNTAVEKELAKIGFTGTLEKALRILDLDSIDVADDGTLVGADTIAADLKTEIPEWFAGRRPAAAPESRVTDGSDVDGPARQPRRPKAPGWDQQIVTRLTGSR